MSSGANASKITPSSVSFVTSFREKGSSFRQSRQSQMATQVNANHPLKGTTRANVSAKMICGIKLVLTGLIREQARDGDDTSQPFLNRHPPNDGFHICSGEAICKNCGFPISNNLAASVCDHFGATLATVVYTALFEHFPA